MELKAIIREIKRSEQTGKIIRHDHSVTNMEFAIGVVLEIGKAKKSSFVIDEDNRWVYEQLIKWIQGDKTFECMDIESGNKMQGDLTKGIYLAGPTGSGKTWALDIMSKLSLIDDIRFFVNGQLTKLEYRSIRTDQICSEYSSGLSVDKYKKMPIICIHDICSASEPTESMYMGNRLKVMQSIIESRGDRQDLITLFTSNIPFDHPLFRERYTDRAVSRMHEMCNYLQLDGNDRRKIK